MKTLCIDDDIKEWPYLWGTSVDTVDEDDIADIRAGKILVFDDGEYTHYLCRPDMEALVEAKIRSRPVK